MPDSSPAKTFLTSTHVCHRVSMPLPDAQADFLASSEVLPSILRCLYLKMLNFEADFVVGHPQLGGRARSRILHPINRTRVGEEDRLPRLWRHPTASPVNHERLRELVEATGLVDCDGSRKWARGAASFVFKQQRLRVEHRRLFIFPPGNGMPYILRFLLTAIPPFIFVNFTNETCRDKLFRLARIRPGFFKGWPGLGWMQRWIDDAAAFRVRPFFHYDLIMQPGNPCEPSREVLHAVLSMMLAATQHRGLRLLTEIAGSKSSARAARSDVADGGRKSDHITGKI
ncbi:MAG: hypothetical protein HY360_27020 [Verrucomicrobia bacterium]|nr:hypothetical protein [Verrucomicrobiota bacterium]